MKPITIKLREIPNEAYLSPFYISNGYKVPKSAATFYTKDKESFSLVHYYGYYGNEYENNISIILNTMRLNTNQTKTPESFAFYHKFHMKMVKILSCC